MDSAPRACLLSPHLLSASSRKASSTTATTLMVISTLRMLMVSCLLLLLPTTTCTAPPHGAFSHTFSRVVRFIVVPAILGVLAGLTASAIGMLVGQAVIFLWQRYRGTKKQEHKAAWEEGAACEKQGLMTETIEYLPEYTEEVTETCESMAKN
ncbi:uncharacterized protein N7483_002695 [Penicillium malachiteum]|uniref:uncharacterized protein n=1 Tax=Penicillium malachiteum TaxID=1324776 RepID=UPI002546EF43|nr:uncharacterized protein N7483_002695 [Penicillium malachiteum]KAJ5737570.1 hypothetical protein N7483_002695 [Penicillium malachiteum]